MTVLYFTSNRERPEFEAKVRALILDHKGDLPLISVSQKPISFGHNVCVGDLGPSPENLLSQLVVGATMADTKFLALVESDGAYPPSYFTFQPTDEGTIYYPDQSWITWNHKYMKMFWPKKRRDISGIMSRDHLLRLARYLVVRPEVYDNRPVAAMSRQEIFPVEYPVVSMVTQESMHQNHGVFGGGVRELPGWGTYDDFWGRFQ